MNEERYRQDPSEELLKKALSSIASDVRGLRRDLDHSQKVLSTEQASMLRWSDEITPHIVQLENIGLFALLAIGLLAAIATVPQLAEFTLVAYLPWALFALVPLIVRVHNPKSRLRKALTFGMGAAGTGGTFGGAITGALVGGWTGPQGALIGGAIGGLIGVVAGLWPEPPRLLRKGEASRYLFERHARRDPTLRMDRILEALDSEIPSYDIDGDGSRAYDQRDLDKWAKEKPWRTTSP